MPDQRASTIAMTSNAPQNDGIMKPAKKRSVKSALTKMKKGVRKMFKTKKVDSSYKALKDLETVPSLETIRSYSPTNHEEMDDSISFFSLDDGSMTDDTASVATTEHGYSSCCETKDESLIPLLDIGFDDCSESLDNSFMADTLMDDMPADSFQQDVLNKPSSVLSTKEIEAESSHESDTTGDTDNSAERSLEAPNQEASIEAEGSKPSATSVLVNEKQTIEEKGVEASPVQELESKLAPSLGVKDSSDELSEESSPSDQAIEATSVKVHASLILQTISEDESLASFHEYDEEDEDDDDSYHAYESGVFTVASIAKGPIITADAATKTTITTQKGSSVFRSRGLDLTVEKVSFDSPKSSEGMELSSSHLIDKPTEVAFDPSKASIEHTQSNLSESELNSIIYRPMQERTPSEATIDSVLSETSKIRNVNVRKAKYYLNGSVAVVQTYNRGNVSTAKYFMSGTFVGFVVFAVVFFSIAVAFWTKGMERDVPALMAAAITQIQKQVPGFGVDDFFRWVV